MTVSTFNQSDFSGQSAAEYFPVIDGDIRVMSRIAAAFAPHQSTPASMQVVVDAGSIVTSTGLSEISEQTSSVIVAPTTNPRIDRVVASKTTGMISIVSGVESASPTAPALPAGSFPIARVSLLPTTVAITNAMITDERSSSPGSALAPGSLINIQRFTASGVYTPTAGTNSVIVEVQGGGGGGGGSAAPTGSQGAAAGGGGSGAFARSRILSGFAGVSVTVGAGGAATAAGAIAGNVGGASSFGSLVTAPGGLAGPAGPAASAPSATFRSGGTANPTGANLVAQAGMTGEFGIVLSSGNAVGGSGGASHLAPGAVGSANFSGGTPNNYGGGGGGGSSYGGSAAQAGGGGGPGYASVEGRLPSGVTERS